MSMVGLYYYLRPLIAMYLRPAEADATPVPVDGIQTVTLALLALLTIVLGIAPGFLSGIL
jgi:NADH-quinone oxidoreductase subunit N